MHAFRVQEPFAAAPWLSEFESYPEMVERWQRQAERAKDAT